MSVVDEHECLWLSGDKSLVIEKSPPLLGKHDIGEENHAEM